MLNSTILCIHQKENDNENFYSWLKNTKNFFKERIIITEDTKPFADYNSEIIYPFHGKSRFSFILSGLFFSSTEKNFVIRTDLFPFNLNEAEILLKNLHSAVDSAMFFEYGRDMNPFFASYSRKIFNKFKSSSFDELETSFVRRLKINKVRPN